MTGDQLLIRIELTDTERRLLIQTVETSTYAGKLAVAVLGSLLLEAV